MTPTAQAYMIARDRADGCPNASATAGAWRALAVRRRTRVAAEWCFAEALTDAYASGRPDLIRAFRRIACHQHGIARRSGRYSPAVVAYLARYCGAKAKGAK